MDRSQIARHLEGHGEAPRHAELNHRQVGANEIDLVPEGTSLHSSIGSTRRR